MNFKNWTWNISYLYIYKYIFIYKSQTNFGTQKLGPPFYCTSEVFLYLRYKNCKKNIYICLARIWFLSKLESNISQNGGAPTNVKHLFVWAVFVNQLFRLQNIDFTYFWHIDITHSAGGLHTLIRWTTHIHPMNYTRSSDMLHTFSRLITHSPNGLQALTILVTRIHPMGYTHSSDGRHTLTRWNTNIQPIEYTHSFNGLHTLSW